jgi:hypothetical protein
MRGSLVQRYKGSWSVVRDLGYDVDPTTGKRKRKQKWLGARDAPRGRDGARDARQAEQVDLR